jgi:hypothetical protein
MRRILQSAALFAAIGACTVASAQQEPAVYDATNFSVKGGVALPLDSNLTNVASSFLALGVEYQIPQSLIPGADTYFSLDWFTKGFQGEKTNIFPFMINARYFLGKDQLAGRRHYVFVGLGVDFIDIYSSSTVVGARAGLGTELGENIFTEAAVYVGDQATGGIHPNAVAAFLGYRF